MRHSLKTGIYFGLTSGAITTLGLMVGLHSGTHSKIIIIGGIITIAVADAFSDALGIHLSEESKNSHPDKEIWEATLATFFSKFIFALTFVLPVFLFSLSLAIIINIIWGLLILSLLSLFIAREKGEKSWKIIGEHLSIALLVITITHFLGDWIAKTFS